MATGPRFLIDPFIIGPESPFLPTIQPGDMIVATLHRNGRGILEYTVTSDNIYILPRLDQTRLFSLFSILFYWLDYILLSCVNSFDVMLSCCSVISPKSFFRGVISAIGQQISYPASCVNLDLRRMLSDYITSNSVNCEWGAIMRDAINDVKDTVTSGIDKVVDQVQSLSIQHTQDHNNIATKVDVLTDKVSQLCDHLMSNLSEAWKPSSAVNCNCVRSSVVPIISSLVMPSVTSVIRTCRNSCAVADFNNAVRVLQFGCLNTNNVCSIWIYPYFRNLNECATLLGKRIGVDNLVFVFDAKASVYLDPTATGLSIFALHSRHELLDPAYREAFITLPRFDYSETQFGRLIYNICQQVPNSDRLLGVLTHEIGNWMVSLMRRVTLPWSLVAQQHYNAILNSEGVFGRKFSFSANEKSLLSSLIQRFNLSAHQQMIEKSLLRFSRQLRTEIIFPCLSASDKRKYYAGIFHSRENVVSVPCGAEVDIGHALFHPCCAPLHAKHVDLSFPDPNLAVTRFGRRAFCPVCYHELPGLPFSLLCTVNCLFYRKIQLAYSKTKTVPSDLQLIPRPARVINYDVLKVHGVHVPATVVLTREFASDDED